MVSKGQNVTVRFLCQVRPMIIRGRFCNSYREGTMGCYATLISIEVEPTTILSSLASAAVIVEGTPMVNWSFGSVVWIPGMSL